MANILVNGEISDIPLKVRNETRTPTNTVLFTMVLEILEGTIRHEKEIKHVHELDVLALTGDVQDGALQNCVVRGKCLKGGNLTVHHSRVY